MADPPAATVSSDQGRASISPSRAKGSPTDPSCSGFLKASCDEKKTIPTRPKCRWEEWGLRGVQCQKWSPAPVGSPCSANTFSGKPQAEPTRPWSVPLQPLHCPSQLLSSQHCRPIGTSQAWRPGPQHPWPQAELQLSVLSGPAASTLWPVMMPGPAPTHSLEGR